MKPPCIQVAVVIHVRPMLTNLMVKINCPTTEFYLPPCCDANRCRVRIRFALRSLDLILNTNHICTNLTLLVG